MRATWRVRAMAVAALVVAVAGCGTDFPMPTETRQTIPPDGSYQLLAAWPNHFGIRDLLVTPGNQPQLFALYNTGGTGATTRGSVVEISRSQGVPLGAPFEGLFNPVALACGGSSGLYNRVFTLDQGDTCMARANPSNGGCDSTGGWNNRITHIEYYWKVVEYDRLGQKLGAFTDTAMAYVNGVAADERGHVYVAGVAIVKLPTTDPRLIERVFEHRVWRYARGLRPDGTADPTVVDPVTGTANGAWHRDDDYELRQGTGVGSVIEARGMQWSAFTGPALFVADLGNFRVQKARDGNVALPLGDYYHTPDIPDGPQLFEPLDVAVDDNGFFYVADATGAQVLRYDNSGPSYVQRVDLELDQSMTPPIPLLRPVTVGADEEYAYVGDAGTNRIVRYRRRT
jgi:hypothetical protein